MKKAILLAGGTGSRLLPFTKLINKHLMPIIDKPIIDYPINTLVGMGVKYLTVVLGGANFAQVVNYLENGSKFGLNINYVFQGEPKGIAEAINLCQPYVEDEEAFAVILGDNLYTKPINWPTLGGPGGHDPFSAKITLYRHPDLYRFGVASIDQTRKIVRIEEKPKTLDESLENYAITGCYQFNRDYFNYYKNLKLSARGEYEIVDIITQYLKNGDLQYFIIDGCWSDAGTFESIEEVRTMLKYLTPVKNGNT